MQDRPWCSSKCVCHPGTVHQVMPQKRRDLTSPPRVRGAAAQAADRRAALSQQLRGIRSPSPWRKRVATGARLELEGYMLTREEAMANGSPAGADWIAAEKATNGAAPIETGARARRSSSVRPPPYSHCRQRLQRSPPPTALAHRSSCHHNNATTALTPSPHAVHVSITPEFFLVCTRLGRTKTWSRAARALRVDRMRERNG